MTRTKLFASSALLFSAAFGGGYYLGQTTTAKKFETKLNDPQRAMGVVLENQNTWHIQFHPANNGQPFGRSGAYVSVFQPRFTGSITYVVFNNTSNGKTYMLQTVQQRVVDGKEKIVTEPPAGFYNGEYTSSLPHVVAEDAERSIERGFNLGKPLPAGTAYADAMDRYKAGKLPHDEYVKDKNLWQTSYREVAEETGLDIAKLEGDTQYKIDRSLYDEIDIPRAYVSIRVVKISGPEIPKLAKLVGDEVISAEFVPLENFDLKTKKVATSTGDFEIKPFVFDSTESLVTKLRSSKRARQ